ncbi:hypothetical protein ACFPYI_02225 [Halomarina salina]|uniref:DUF7344 domain-containing protein n=1 Tax=Halomarina salina TaxID=1872699 RepID=A0ABD5RIM6_9EURY|nr:hypothetical protein [Halomarina salina]
MLRSRLSTRDGGTDGEEHAAGVTEHEMFTTLSNARRLSVLRYLVDADEPTDLGTLVESVASAEFGVPVADLERKQERRIYVALHQNHLPYLEEIGLVEWDRSRGIISLRGGETVEQYLGATDARSGRSYGPPLALSMCSLGLVAGYLMEFTGGLAVSSLGALTAVTAAVLLSAGAVWTTERPH